MKAIYSLRIFIIFCALGNNGNISVPSNFSLCEHARVSGGLGPQAGPEHVYPAPGHAEGLQPVHQLAGHLPGQPAVLGGCVVPGDEGDKGSRADGPGIRNMANLTAGVPRPNVEVACSQQYNLIKRPFFHRRWAEFRHIRRSFRLYFPETDPNISTMPDIRSRFLRRFRSHSKSFFEYSKERVRSDLRRLKNRLQTWVLETQDAKGYFFQSNCFII